MFLKKIHKGIRIRCAIENYRADTDLLAYVEGKWEVTEYQTFYEYLCSMDWLKIHK